MIDFRRSFIFVLAREGGFVDDPRDRGGATNRGVTQRTYDSWRARNDLQPQSVKLITDEELAAIYRQDYWNKVRGDDLPPPVNLAVFDAAVNSGPARAARWLQRACGAVVDGVIGPGTIGAVRARCEEKGAQDVASDIIALREDFYHGIVAADPSQNVFLRGWLNRLDELEREVANA